MAIHIEWQKIRAEVAGFMNANVVQPLKEDKFFTITLVVAVLALAGWWGNKGYRWYRERSSQKAQVAFLDAVDAYESALVRQVGGKPQERAEAMEQAEIDVRQSYTHYKHSSFAPCLESILAQIQMLKGNKAQAIKDMRSGASSMGAPFAGMYEVTLALMELDGDKPEQGVSGLQAIANDDKHSAQDMALYYLGLYYRSQGNTKGAVHAWEKLAAMKHESTEQDQFAARMQSPWVQRAQVQLGRSN